MSNLYLYKEIKAYKVPGENQVFVTKGEAISHLINVEFQKIDLGETVINKLKTALRENKELFTEYLNQE